METTTAKTTTTTTRPKGAAEAAVEKEEGESRVEEEGGRGICFFHFLIVVVKMVWHEWWPYDPVPQSAGTDPYVVKVERNKVYWWCSCGRSRRQPWCDGSHKGTAFKPVMYVPQVAGPKLMCGCKFSETRPLCNGTHNWVKVNQHTPQAAAVTFAFFFGVGVFTTFLGHP